MPLRGSSRFASVYRDGTKHRRGSVTIFRASSASTTPELGVVAGRRVGNAVTRNRAKRRLREAARRIDLQPQTAYVVVAGEGTADVAFDDLVEWMRAAVHESDTAA